MKTRRIMTGGIFLLSVLTCAAVFAQQPKQTDHAQGDGVRQEADTNGPAPRILYTGQAADYATPQNVYQASHALHSESIQLAHKYVKTESDDEKRDLRKKLRDALAREFDQNIKQQQKEFEGVEKQITQMRSLPEKRAAAKNKTLNRRLEHLQDE